jgi:hypothetical protein
MNSDALELVSEENLPRVRAVARDGAVQGAVGSLAAWGAINAGAWFFLNGDSRQLLTQLNNPGGDIYFLVYGGLIIGCVMLAFAIFGLLTRLSLAIMLNGLSLLGVGVWNLAHDSFANSALQPYGYSIKDPSTTWILLGIAQIIWGARELGAFARVSGWSCADLNRQDRQELKQKLRAFVAIPASAESGVVKASITIGGPLGFAPLSRTVQYTGRLLDQSVVFLSAGLDDCFRVERQAMSTAKFSASSVEALVDGTAKQLALGPSSTVILKQWSGKPFAAADSQQLAGARTAAAAIVEPHLHSDNARLRGGSAAALEPR